MGQSQKMAQVPPSLVQSTPWACLFPAFSLPTQGASLLKKLWLQMKNFPSLPSKKTLSTLAKPESGKLKNKETKILRNMIYKEGNYLNTWKKQNSHPKSPHHSQSLPLPFLKTAKTSGLTYLSILWVFVLFHFHFTFSPEKGGGSWKREDLPKPNP